MRPRWHGHRGDVVPPGAGARGGAAARGGVDRLCVWGGVTWCHRVLAPREALRPEEVWTDCVFWGGDVVPPGAGAQGGAAARGGVDRCVCMGGEDDVVPSGAGVRGGTAAQRRYGWMWMRENVWENRSRPNGPRAQLHEKEERAHHTVYLACTPYSVHTIRTEHKQRAHHTV
eukprot:363635-Chlamydomonas_euryale.AAC.2